jgi:hypothetical protein
MSKFFRIVILSGAVALVGCSGQKFTPTLNPPPPTPLSLEEWKSLPISEKYDGVTFDRLRMNDPQLKSDAVWNDFMQRVIIPERNQDIPPVPVNP